METWKQIEGYEGMYEISDLGNIKRISPARGTHIGHILTPWKMPKRPYRIVFLSRNPKDRKAFRVCRLVAKAFIGNPPTNNHQINHKNGIHGDDRVENLEWVTPSQNTRHRFDVLKQQNPRGENHHNTKLKREDIFKIRKLACEGIPHRKIGEMFGVKRVTITAIHNRRNWGHI